MKLNSTRNEENAASYGVLYYELVTPFGKLTKKMVTAGK